MNYKHAPHFSPSEFACKCGCPTPRPVAEKNEHLAFVLETQFRLVFKRPVVINSGYRCPEHNAKIGGAPNSRHLHGDAVDLWIPGLSGQFLAGYVFGLMHNGVIPWGGIGTYEAHPNLLHLDLRGEYARWHYPVKR